VRHAHTFTIEQLGAATVVRVRAPLADSARLDRAPQHEGVVLLVPHGVDVPPLEGALAGATVVRTPVQRIALNSNNEEAFLLELGLADRIVAVGGTNSYDDSVRARVLRGEIKQIGYGWHRAPDLDVALATRPDVLVLRVIKPTDTPSLDRARALGLAAVPYLGEVERSYLGRAERIKFFALLSGRAALADSIFAEISARVDSLRNLAASRPKRSVFWAYLWNADRWQGLVRGPIAELLRDAGGINVLEQPDDPRQPEQSRFSTEQLLARARAAECWFAGDGFPQPLPRNRISASFRAWRERCVFFNNGRVKASADAWDWFQRAPVRPDLVLAEFIKALHPDLITSAFDYIVPNADYGAR
jgi:ABC-type Fe3+-hydroxamate transport system substrate-binding protein